MAKKKNNIHVGFLTHLGGLKPLKTAKGMIGSFAGAVTKGMGTAAKGFAVAGLAIQGIQTIANGLISAASGPLSLAAAAESTATSFEVLLGSVDASQKIMGELKAFAASTPFEFPEIADSAKKLIAFGFNANEVTGELRKLGDISAGLQIPMNELSDIYGKAKVSGRLFMEDINQLAGRGIPIQAELAKQFGVSGEAVRDLVSSGQVNFSHLQTAITSLTGEGGKFAGLMEKQSSTLGGLWSTMVDNFNEGLTELGLGIADAFNLKELQKNLIGFIQQGTAWIKGFMATLKNIVAEVTPVWKAWGSTLSVIFYDLLNAGKALIDNLGSWLGSFGVTFDSWRNALITGIVAVEFAWTNFGTLIGLAGKQILADILAIAGGFMHSFTVVIPAYLSWFATNWKNIFENIANFSINVIKNITHNIKSLWQDAVNWLARITVQVLGKAQGLTDDQIKDQLDTLKEMQAQAGKIEYKSLTDGFESTLAELPKIPDRVMGELEANINADIANTKENLADGFNKLLDKRMKEVFPSNITPTSTAAVGATNTTDAVAGVAKQAAETKLAGLAERGSKEARDTLLRARSGGGKGSTEEKALSESKKQTKFLETIAGKTAEQTTAPQILPL